MDSNHLKPDRPVYQLILDAYSRCVERTGAYPKRLTLGYNDYRTLRARMEYPQMEIWHHYGKGRFETFMGVPVKVAPRRRTLIMAVPDIKRPRTVKQWYSSKKKTRVFNRRAVNELQRHGQYSYSPLGMQMLDNALKSS
jgi:hypothetical protein